MVLRLRPVVSFLGSDPAATATRILAITQEAWNQVKMQMRHDLPGCRAIVDPHVVAVRTKFFLQVLLRKIHQHEELEPLSRRCFKDGRDVASRDDETGLLSRV